MIDKNMVKRYLAEVDGALENAKDYRRSVLGNLEADIWAFLSENKDATEADLLAYFGNPGDYAAEYACVSFGGQNVRQAPKKPGLTAVVAGVIAALLIWGIGVGTAVADNAAVNDGYLKIYAEYSQREG